jgi:hypothetical protein
MKNSNQPKTRNRLHKEPPARKSLYACPGIFDVVRAQSCLTIFPEDEDDGADEGERAPTSHFTEPKTNKPLPATPPPHIAMLLQEQDVPSNPSTPENSSNSSSASSDSEDAASIYSSADEMGERESLKRTRPKTPVFAVGQLERASMIRQLDEAQIIAEGYQSVLPPRIDSPLAKRKPSNRTLRKIKCQLSLRDLVKDQAKNSPRTSISSSYSDAETLVGSESSPSSPRTPKEGHVAMGRMPLTRPLQLSQKKLDDNDDDGDNNEKPIALPTFDNDIGLKICVDLLTDELATTLLRHNPTELGDRAAGLQILLLIEAYETVQQQVRQKLDAALLHGTGSKERHMMSIEHILEHWLQVLYAVYDRSHVRKHPDSRSVEECPLQNRPDEGLLAFL